MIISEALLGSMQQGMLNKENVEVVVNMELKNLAYSTRYIYIGLSLLTSLRLPDL